VAIEVTTETVAAVGRRFSDVWIAAAVVAVTVPVAVAGVLPDPRVTEPVAAMAILVAATVGLSRARIAGVVAAVAVHIAALRVLVRPTRAITAGVERGPVHGDHSTRVALMGRSLAAMDGGGGEEQHQRSRKQELAGHGPPPSRQIQGTESRCLRQSQQCYTS
jgi:hypothetical protein